MLDVVAELADVWSAFGGLELVDEHAFYASVAEQIGILDLACAKHDRDPATLRRSLLAFRPLTPWRSEDSFRRTVDMTQRLGFDELILYPPGDDHERGVYNSVIDTVMPTLRTV
jgi:hypothetical protein